MAIHILLNELNQKVELENINKNRSAEFLKYNPRGQVPVLLDGNFAIREGGAIMIYLLDKHKNNIMPKEGESRAKALEWLMVANASLHPLYSRLFFALRSITDENLRSQIIKPTLERIHAIWKEVDEQLGKTKYLGGNEVSAADILFAIIANWGVDSFPFQIEKGENVKKMLREIIKRESFQAALKSEGAEYKAV